MCEEVFPIADKVTLMACNSFIRKGKLYLIGGHRGDEIWTPNYSKDFDTSKTLQTFNYIVDINNGKITSKPVLNHTRYIGATLDYIPEEDISITFGGLCQTHDGKSLLVNTLSQDTFIHNWAKNESQLAETSDLKPKFRCFHSSAYDPKRSLLWICGGCTADKKIIQFDENKSSQTMQINDNLQDVWIYERKQKKWLLFEGYNETDQDKVETFSCSLTKDDVFSCMAYLNDHIYIVCGREFSTCILDLDLNKMENIYDRDHPWRRIDIPPNSRIPIGDSRLLIFRTPMGRNELMIFGGTQSHFHSALLVTANVDESPEATPEPLRILSYGVETEEFRVIEFPSLRNLALFSLDQTDRHFILSGGIELRGKDFITWNRSIVRIPKWRCFDLEKLAPELVALNRIPRISSSFATDFCRAVMEDCKNYRESERFKELLELFERQMEEPVPINDRVIAGALSGEQKIINRRIPNWTDDLLVMNDALVRDLMLWCYTDAIVVEDSDRVQYQELCEFILRVYKAGAIRLAWLEVALRASTLSAYQILGLALMSVGGDKVIGNDPRMSIILALVYEAMDLHEIQFNRVTFKRLVALSDIEAVIEAIRGGESLKNRIGALEMPLSTIDSDLATSDRNPLVDCLDGPIFVDLSELGIEPEVLRDFPSAVVEAVVTHRMRTIIPVFSSLPVTESRKVRESILLAIGLLNKAGIDLDAEHMNRIFGDTIEDIRRYLTIQGFARDIVTFLDHIGQWPMIEFMIQLVGSSAQTRLVNDECSVGVHEFAHRAHLQREGGQIKTGLSTAGMCIIVYLLYSKFTFASVEALFPAYIVADTLLSFIAEYPDGLARPDHTAVVNYIIRILFVDSQGNFLGEAFGKRFDKVFKAGIQNAVIAHARSMQDWGVPVAKYRDTLNEDALKWVLRYTASADSETQIHRIVQEESPSDSESDDTTDCYEWVRY